MSMDLSALITAAQSGDLEAYGRVVTDTQAMVHAVCFRILRDPTDAADAAQDAYLRAFERLADVREPAAFAGWLRRVAITAAHDLRRRRRGSFVALDDLPELPYLDELEESWSEGQRLALAAALAAMGPDDRRLCDRFYHGRWPVARLAGAAAVSEAAMRKRLQRIRDTLRKEIEMTERQSIPNPPANLPAKVVELLAHPRLVDLPENPVGRMAELLRGVYGDYQWVELPEIIDVAAARGALHEERIAMEKIAAAQHVDASRALRYDLSVPMLMAAREMQANAPRLPLRLVAAGQVYHAGRTDAMHLEAFHQFEVLHLASGMDPWAAVGGALRALNTLFPQTSVRLTPVRYPLCRQSWQLDVEIAGRVTGIAGCGLYTEEVTRALGGDTANVAAFGIGFGLERLAALKFNYADLRQLETARVGTT